MAELPGQRQRDSEWGLRCAAVAVGALLLSTVGASGQPAPVIGQEGKDVPWVPTPEVLVDTMLEMAAVGPGDYVMDLGSGDGRTVVAAARLGARAVGVELDPRLVAASKQYAIEAGVADRTEFLATDLFDVDLSRATVITMFLLPDINTRLRPSLLALEPGTRIVSNTWDMGGSESDPDAPGWIPDETVVLDPCPSFCTSLFWIVPANVSGTWRLVDQEQEAELELAQEFQITSGRLLTNSRIEDVGEGRPRGRETSFSIGDTSYRGRVDGDTMTGTARADDGTSKWRAARVN